MGFFGELLDKVKDTVMGKEMPEKPIIKLCMMGPRGVGKTSLLTSVYLNMDDAVSGTGMYIKADTGTDILLKEKAEALRAMFQSGSTLEDEVRPGIAGDDVESDFAFDFGLNTKNIQMGLEIKDFPGEYVNTKPEVVKAYIVESSAILLAIDTPHLMEHDGKYNEAKNRTAAITRFVKETADAWTDRKLVMLVPLKCEKYYHAGDIDLVTQKVEQTYQELISFLRDQKGMYGKHACVITPILTLGDVVFDKFGGENGEVAEVLSHGELLPKYPKYRYWKAGAKYNPKYCEQPVYYLLSYVAKLYREMKADIESTGLLRKIKKYLQQMPENDVILEEMLKFSVKKINGLDGFKVCFGKGKV